jgi:hypothetical protein
VTELPTGTVTFLFTDIEGSTKLLQELGDRYGPVQDDHMWLMREAIVAGGKPGAPYRGGRLLRGVPLGPGGGPGRGRRPAVVRRARVAARPPPEGADGDAHRRREARGRRLPGDRRQPGRPHRRRRPRRPGAPVGGHRALVANALPEGVGIGDLATIGSKTSTTPSRSTSWSSTGCRRSYLRSRRSRPRRTSRRSRPRSSGGSRRSRKSRSCSRVRAW